VRRDAGVLLVARGGDVDEELTAQSVAARVVALGVDAPTVAVLTVARPGDDNIAQQVKGDRRVLLIAGSGGVDAELIAQGVAIGVVALGGNTPTVAVLAVTRPGDDEAAFLG